MNILGIIPARGGSKRVPRKNLRLLNGKPLVAWVIEAARFVEEIDSLVVSSDDDEILTIAEEYDAHLPLLRPDEFATDSSPAIEYVKHALELIEAKEGTHFNAVVILQPSSPLTLPQDISATIELLKSSGAETAVSVVQLEHAIHPVKLKVMEDDKLLPYLEEERGRMSENELPKLFVRNCAVYATRRDVIDRGDIIGTDCRGFVMPRERSVDINDEMDFMFAEFLSRRSTPSAKESVDLNDELDYLFEGFVIRQPE